MNDVKRLNKLEGYILLYIKTIICLRILAKLLNSTKSAGAPFVYAGMTSIAASLIRFFCIAKYRKRLRFVKSKAGAYEDFS